MSKKYLELISLPYEYNALEPYISEEQLKLHYQKHHQAYITNGNALIEKIERAREEGAELDFKSALKAFSFNAGGHFLHEAFWKNMAPAGEGGGGEPKDKLAKAIEEEFGSFERFKSEFSQTANTVEGSGWAVLVFSEKMERLLIAQIEKHNVNLFPAMRVLLALDVWEHAYYLDYKNDRAKFIEVFWDIVDWKEVEWRFENK